MKRWILLLAMGAWCGCEENSPPNPSGQPYVQAFTDKTTYISNERIVFTVSNPVDEPIALEACQDKIVFMRDRLQHSDWTLWYTYTCGSTTSPGRRVLSPETLAVDSLRVSKTGYYRLRLPFLWNNDPDRPDTAVTNTFLVTVN